MLKKERLEAIKARGRDFHQKINKKILSYITAGFGLIAGLAWNDAIKSFIEYFLPLSQNTLVAKFGYAFFMTIALVIISVYLAKILKQESKEK